jgi:ribonuclease HII
MNIDSSVTVQKRQRSPPPPLQRFYDDNFKYELCIDEAGRGCLFGRVYIACVVLPKESILFSGKDIKDSKKFSSKKKIREVATYIKTNALSYYIAYIDETVIDKINILQAVMKGMHECIKQSVSNLSASIDECIAVIDGNYFISYVSYDTTKEMLTEMRHVTIEQGDSKLMGIAAASILAKTARDDYVLELCEQHPELIEKYGLDKNMGYGTKTHLDGIRQHGVTKWHRKTFGICKSMNIVDDEKIDDSI